MYDIFLSYSSQDRERLAPLVDTFRQQGWTVFWDHESVPVGKTYPQYIEEGLRDSTCVVVVWSENSIKSEWVREEANKAKKRGVMLPARLDHNVPPFGFGEYQAADLSQWQGDTTTPAFQALAAAVRGHVDAARAQAERQAKQDQLAQQQDELTRLQTELQQQQKTLHHAQTQLAEQRELLELRSQAAQQKERERQTELAQQTEAAQQLVASKQAELSRQTLEFEQQRAELERQLEAAKHAGQSEPELVAAQQRIDELNVELATARKQAHLAEQQAAESAQRLATEITANQAAQQQLAEQQRQTETLQNNLSAQLTALQDQHKRALQQAEAARLAAAEQQHAAENQLRAAQLAQQSQQSEFVQLNQQLADQQRELTTLRARPPVEKVVEKLVEKVVVKEVRSSKDKLIGAVLGLVAGGVLAWGVIGNHSGSDVANKTPNTPAASAPVVTSGISPIKPVEDKEAKKLTARERAKEILRKNEHKAEWPSAMKILESADLVPLLDGEATYLIAANYEGVQKNYANACHWYEQSAQKHYRDAEVRLSKLRQKGRCAK